MKRWRRRESAHMDQATGNVTWHKAPVPPPARGGTGTIPGAGEAPPLPAPAPGHNRGHHMVIDVWECGCIHTWTRATGWNRDFDHVDAALERLLRDEH